MTARLYKFRLWRLTVGIVFGVGMQWAPNPAADAAKE